MMNTNKKILQLEKQIKKMLVSGKQPKKKGPPRKRRVRLGKGVKRGAAAAARALHPVATQYYNALSQPFHENVQGVYIPVNPRPSQKVSSTIRFSISVVSGQTMYIYPLPAFVSDKPQLVFWTGASVDSQQIGGTVTAGNSCNVKYADDLPYTVNTMSSTNTCGRVVSAAIRMTCTTGPSNRIGVIEYMHDPDSGFALAQATSNIGAIQSAPASGRRICSLANEVEFEATFGAWSNGPHSDVLDTARNYAEGWFTVPDGATNSDTACAGYGFTSQGSEIPWGNNAQARSPSPHDIITIDTGGDIDFIVEYTVHVEYSGAKLARISTPSPTHEHAHMVASAFRSAKSKHANSPHKHFSSIMDSAMSEVLGELKSAATHVASRALPLVEKSATSAVGSALAMLI